MAFNPFNWFRKHQKVIFAGLILLTMVVFIGQFGAGDVFQQGLAWFGSNRTYGQQVVTLNGKAIYESDLERTARLRRMASIFLSTNAAAAQTAVCRDLLDNHVKATGVENPLSGLREVVEAASARTGQFAMFFLRQESTRMQLRREIETLARIATRKEVRDEPERLGVLQRVASVLGFQIWLSSADPRTMYFGGTDRPEDILDFILWKQQADRVGIRLTEEDIKREVVAETGGHEVFDAKARSLQRDTKVKMFLDQFNRANSRTEMPYTVQDLLDGLQEEFRVVMMKSSLLGLEPGARAYRNLLRASSSPALASPDEFFEFFRQNRTVLKTSLLRIQVDQFLKQVTDTPSNEELKDLFEVYKDREPRPDSREPGFMQPRRIVVEYVAASPNSQHYQDKAKDQVKALVNMSDPKLRTLLALGSIGVPPLQALVPAVDPIQMELDADLAKADHLWFHNPRAGLMDYEKQVGKLHYTNVADGKAFAPAFAALAQGNPLVGLTSLFANATILEVRDSLKLNLTELLKQSDPQQLFSTAALAAAALPKPAPRSLLEPQILAALRERQAMGEVRKILDSLADEVRNLRGQNTKIREAIDKAIKEGKLTTYRMKKSATRDELRELLKNKVDAGLIELQTALQPRLPQQQQTIDGVLADLFQGNGKFELQPLSVTEPKKVEYLYWRTEDDPARPKSFDEAKPEVVAAWRLDKARQLARKKADSLREEINKANLNAKDAEARLHEAKLGAIFDLENVSVLMPQKEILAGRGTFYVPYKIPDQSVENFPYPPANLVKEMMDLKRPGAATIVVDRPVTSFYVIVLQDRNEPTMKEFKAIYTATPRDDSLYTNFTLQRQEEYVKSYMEQLRKDAGAVDSDGRYKIPDSIRNRGSVLSDQNQ